MPEPGWPCCPCCLADDDCEGTHDEACDIHQEEATGA